MSDRLFASLNRLVQYISIVMRKAVVVALGSRGLVGVVDETAVILLEASTSEWRVLDEYLLLDLHNAQLMEI